MNGVYASERESEICAGIRLREKNQHKPIFFPTLLFCKRSNNSAPHTGERPVNSNFINFLPWVSLFSPFARWVCERQWLRCVSFFSLLLRLDFVYIVSTSCHVCIEWSIAYRRKRKWKYRSEWAKFTKNKHTSDDSGDNDDWGWWRWPTKYSKYKKKWISTVKTLSCTYKMSLYHTSETHTRSAR